MILKMYVFFDRISQSYLPQLMLMPNDDVCKRGIKKLVNNPQFPHKDIVEDLELFCVGSFNAETGIVEPDKYFMLNCVDLKEV